MPPRCGADPGPPTVNALDSSTPIACSFIQFHYCNDSPNNDAVKTTWTKRHQKACHGRSRRGPSRGATPRDADASEPAPSSSACWLSPV